MDDEFTIDDLDDILGEIGMETAPSAEASLADTLNNLEGMLDSSLPAPQQATWDEGVYEEEEEEEEYPEEQEEEDDDKAALREALARIKQLEAKVDTLSPRKEDEVDDDAIFAALQRKAATKKKKRPAKKGARKGSRKGGSRKKAPAKKTPVAAPEPAAEDMDRDLEEELAMFSLQDEDFEAQRLEAEEDRRKMEKEKARRQVPKLHTSQMNLHEAKEARQEAAPWGRETMRLPNSPDSEAKFKEAFPDSEEKVAREIPVIHPNDVTIMLNLKLVDGRKIQVQAALSWKVVELVWATAKQLEVWQDDFFAISESDVADDAADRWLDPHKTLKEEGLSKDTSLIFKIKYFKYPKKLRDPGAVFFFYAQMRHEVLRGMLETSEIQAFQLASYDVAIHNWTAAEHQRRGFLTKHIKELLLSDHAANPAFPEDYAERRILQAYNESVCHFSRTDALYGYLKTVKDLPLYGSTIFNVTVEGAPRVMAVAEDGYLFSDAAAAKFAFFTIRNQQVTKFVHTPYEDLQSAFIDPEQQALVLSVEGGDGPLNVKASTRSLNSILELICGYRKMLEFSKKKMAPFRYPIAPAHPNPALYAKPAKRKKFLRQTSRADAFKIHYMKACEKFACKHDPAVIREVDLALDTDTPVKKLDLSRCKWDLKQLQAFFEGLKSAKAHTWSDDEDFLENMRMNELNLSNLRLVKGSLGALREGLKTVGGTPYQVTHLTLRRLILGDKGVAALCEGLEQMKHLEVLDVADNGITQKATKALLGALMKANSRFTGLLLAKNQQVNTAMKFMTAMLDRNSELAKLDLSDNGFDEKSIAFLMIGLKGHRITYLNLSGGKFGNCKGCYALIDWAIQNIQLKTFKIARNGLSGHPAKMLGAMLNKSSHQLECLDISGNNWKKKDWELINQGLSTNFRLTDLNYGGVHISGKTFAMFCTGVGENLMRLAIGNCGIQKNAFHFLAKSLLDKTPKLQYLDLSGAALLKDVASDVKDFMEKHPGLCEIKFNGCSFDKASWSALGGAMKNVRKVRKLHLDGIKLSKANLPTLIESLRQNESFVYLSVRSCGLDDGLLLSLLKAFDPGSLSKIRTIDVRSNKKLVGMLQNKTSGPKYRAVQEKIYLEFLWDRST